MAISDMAKQTVTIEKVSPRIGNAGGETAEYETRVDAGGEEYADVPASIQNQGGRLVETFARRGITISHAVYTDVDISECRIGDRVTDQDGDYYVVRYVSDMAGQNRGWSLYVDQIPPASANR